MFLLFSACGISSGESTIDKQTTSPTAIVASEVTPPAQTETGIDAIIQSPSPPPSPSPPYPISLPALIQQEIVGSDLALEQVLAQNAEYTRYRISYRANDLGISGIMNIPKGDGPFPLLILNHGYIDPAVYTNGRGLKREQDFLAKEGFAVLHPDYRNHALSDKDPDNTRDFRLGYTIDVIGAILAVQDSQLPQIRSINAERVGMLGHSMGGGITQNVLVVRPELVQAAVLYAPVSANAVENLEQYFLRRNSRQAVVDEIYATHGSPEEVPEFWENISPQNFFERIKAPVLIFIGTNDDSTPPQWSRDIAEHLQGLEKDVELVVYENEKHEFIPRWQDFMQQSSAFFREHL